MADFIETPTGAISFVENKDNLLISVKEDITLANTAQSRMSDYSGLTWETEYTNLESGDSCSFQVLPGFYPYYCVNHAGQKPTWGQIMIG